MMELYIYAVALMVILIILSPTIVRYGFKHFPYVRHYLAHQNSNDLIVVSFLIAATCIIVLLLAQFENTLLKQIVIGMQITFTQFAFLVFVLQRIASNDIRSRRSVSVPLCLLPTYKVGLSYEQRMDALKRQLEAAAPILGYAVTEVDMDGTQLNPIKADFMIKAVDEENQEVLLEFIDQFPNQALSRDHVVCLDYECSNDIDSISIDYIGKALLMPKDQLSYI